MTTTRKSSFSASNWERFPFFTFSGQGMNLNEAMMNRKSPQMPFDSSCMKCTFRNPTSWKSRFLIETSSKDLPNFRYPFRGHAILKIREPKKANPLIYYSQNQRIIACEQLRTTSNQEFLCKNSWGNWWIYSPGLERSSFARFIRDGPEAGF